MSVLLEKGHRAFGAEPIDQALSDAVSDWLDSSDPILPASVAALSEALRAGHSCLDLSARAGTGFRPRAESVQSGPDAPALTFPDLSAWHARLDALPIGPDDPAPIVLDGHRLYLRRYWRFETELAASLHSRLADPPAVDVSAVRGTLERLFPPADTDRYGPDWQKVAAANALAQRLSVIVGGPGTGKTHTVTRLLAALIDSGSAAPDGGVPRIELAAPTGKAAQRLSESVGLARTGLNGVVPDDVLEAVPQAARTLHRLLGVRADGGFRHHGDRPLSLDVLVVDEVSMVDLPLMARLFRALPAACRIVLLGDADQLPSVAAGSVLADLAPRPHPGFSAQRRRLLADLGVLPAETSRQTEAADPAGVGADHLSELRESRRYDSTGGIGRLAGAVMAGEVTRSVEVLNAGGAQLQWRAASALPDAVSDWIDRQYAPVSRAAGLADAFERLAAFRILCPARSGPAGVDAVNERILRALNPRRRPFFAGQPVMVTRNAYGVGLYNGDVGLVWPDEEGRLLVWFPEADGHRPMAPGRLPPHETVYAMTIHKTQGSEFDRVALVLPEQPGPGLSRELLYTGLTRARHGVTVVGSEAVWRAAVGQRVERHSGLGERLFGAGGVRTAAST